MYIDRAGSPRSTADRGVDHNPKTLSAHGNKLPPGFDPQAYPVIAAHWFGIEAETSTHTIDADASVLDREAA